VLDVNPAAAALVRRSRAEIVRAPALEFVDLRDRRPVVRAFRRVMTGATTSALVSCRVRTGDGAPAWVDCSIGRTPPAEAGGAFCHAVLVDVTERRRIESAEGNLAARRERLLDSAPDAILCTRPDGTITLVNAQCEILFGYTPAELIGQAVELLVPDRVAGHHPQRRAGYYAAPTTRPMGAGLELSARRRDGSEFPVDISLAHMEMDDGPLVVAAVRDMTDRRRIEADQAQLRADLERARQDEERAVLEAQLHQAQRLESIGQLAGGIAHDFNNLLAGILNYAELVSAGLQDLTVSHGLGHDPVAVALSEDIGQIATVAKRAAQLTHQLLIFSRRETVKPEVVDLNAVVSDMEKLLKRIIRESVELATSLQPGLPAVLIDPGQLEQVIMNLAVNARDAMATTGGHLRIQTTTFDVDDDYARERRLEPGPYVRLTVSDTGGGMTPEVLDRAFEPFFSTKPRDQGSGLGLATVYGIVTQAGGEIKLYSELDLGTTIRIHLPVVRAESRPIASALTEDEYGGRGETILLVEDEDMVREPTRRMLVRQGYDVLVAANADEALALVADPGRSIDVLLTDVIMPGRSGKELATELCRLGRTDRVIFMSGYTEDVIVHQGVLESGVHLIEKPFESRRLLRLLRSVLDDGRGAGG
jgi:PAS domain S-box-containing protein